ncbi:MAG: hypothetical protein KatS3mg083_577 [Candidatus Dojkabacteria bacterium]|nr:MAG: hypothetical protein KatS3mg083_577 [Candidatus Dojkabacteria bacterium]
MKKGHFFIGLVWMCLSLDTIGQQLYFQGFEPGDNWTILQGNANISNDNGASYTPANQTIRSGTNFWKVNNSIDTLLLESKNVTGQNNLKIVVRLASISTTSANGAESTDSVQIFAIIDGNLPSQADATIIGATNSRWGYNAILVGSTTAGTPVTFISPQNGTSTNNYSTIEILIPNGTSTVGLMIRGKNNNGNEIWAIDDIELVSCPNVIVSGPSTGCLGDTLTFSSTEPGDWSVGNTNAQIVSNTTNTTTVQVVLTNGSSTAITQTIGSCSFTKNISIYAKPTPPFVGPVNPICQGQTATLTANSANNTIHWFDSPTGSSIGTGNTFVTPPIQQTGTVTYYAAAQNVNGCFSSKVPVNITVNPAPIQFAISGATVCSQDDAIISLNGSENNIEYELYVNNVATGQTYSGNGQPLDFIITNPVQGTIVFIAASDPNTGCTTFSDTITLNIVNAPNNFYTFNVDTLTLCENDTAHFMLSGSQIGIEYSVLLSGNFTGVSQMGTGQTLSFSITGVSDGDIINIFALDTLTGCFVDLLDEIYVQVYPKPEITISENAGIFTADSTVGTFVWYYNGNIIPGQNQNTLNISQAGTGTGNYFLVYTNNWGCKDTSNTINLIVSDLEKKWKDFIQVYPNPFQNQFTLEVPQSMNLYISNVLGQTLYSQPIEKGKNVIDLEAFPSGVYFIELQWKEEQWNTKLIKN